MKTKIKFNNKKIFDERKKLGLSADGLARRLHGIDVTHQTIRNWEKGANKPNCHDLAELCMFFGKSVSYFFDKQEGV